MFLFARVFGLFYYCFPCSEKSVLYEKVPRKRILAYLSGIKEIIVNI